MEIGEFRIFLTKACRRIPLKKLKSRIHSELHEHMEDMLDDFLEAGEEREAAIQKVIKEMGDPVKINKNLRRAHRKKIVLVCSAKVIASFLILALIDTLPFFGSAVSKYCFSNTKEDIDAALLQSEHNYKYCGEIERNGRVYILYADDTSDKNRVEYYESVRLFSKFNIHNKFSGSGGGSGDGNILISLGFTDNKSENEVKVYFSFKPIKAKYFKMGFTKTYDYVNDDRPDDITGDFIAVPNIGEYVIIDAPEGYRFSGFYYPYDENKQLIQHTDSYDPDIFPIGESWKSSHVATFGNSGCKHS